MFYSEIAATDAGHYRTRQIIITGSQYPVCYTARIQDEMRALFQWANSERNKYHPIEFAAQLHKRFVFIHPFIDGNGRISRLLMNTALIQDGYMLAVIPPVLRHDYISTIKHGLM
jgi:Fic family protein